MPASSALDAASPPAISPPPNILLGRRLSGRVCGFHSDCPQRYSLVEVNRSAALWDPSDREAIEALRAQHDKSRSQCASSKVYSSHALRKIGNGTGQLQTGGWCLTPPPSSSSAKRELHTHVALPNGQSYYLPRPHVAADSVIVDFLARTLKRCDDPPTCSAHTFLSIIDMGAGVGQYGHALRSLDSRYNWRGYDGAGNIEEVSDGFMSFFDLTIPLALPRADWVMSLEVGEHIPSEREKLVVRNIHAHNCRGVLLSWAQLGKWGVGHVNNHRSQYLIDVFTGLGYRYNVNATEALHANRPKRPVRDQNVSQPWWWLRSALVFERITPLTGSGCTV